jgi:hypothetical protein
MNSVVRFPGFFFAVKSEVKRVETAIPAQTRRRAFAEPVPLAEVCS